jgi:rhamnogalacturonyl hydrolase YesR
MMFVERLAELTVRTCRSARISARPLATGALLAWSINVFAAEPQGRSLRSADGIALAEKAADYQLATLAAGELPPSTNPDTADLRGWIQGTFFVGLTALADRSSKTAYRQAVLARGHANQWQLGNRVYHADDHVIGATYIWASEHGAGLEAIAPLRTQFDRILKYPPQVGLEHREYDDPRGVGCDQRWCWADALFMAPPVWFQLSQVTGDARYAGYAKSEFNAVTDFLYDADEHLYRRDSRFAARRGPHGEKIFWSRGVGWVFAGLARSIPYLAAGDPTRTRMERIFKDMARRLIELQKPDGYWAPSLLAPTKDTPPESSGTAFFTYGFAWGLKTHVLSGREYEAAMQKGWSALVRAVHPDGKLGYVQQVSDRPDDVKYEDTQLYGVGAFLLAATAVADLSKVNARASNDLAIRSMNDSLLAPIDHEHGIGSTLQN